MKGKKKFEMGEHSFLWGTLVVAIIFFAAAVMLYRAHPGVGGDAAFPVMAAFIMLLGAALSILEVRHWEPAHPERLSLAEKAVLAYRMLFPDKTLIMFLYVLLYALILGSLGFNIATFLYLFASMITLRPKNILRSGLIALGITAGIWLIFGVAFRVRLP